MKTLRAVVAAVIIAAVIFGMVRKLAEQRDDEDLRIETGVLRAQVAEMQPELDNLRRLGAAKDIAIAKLMRSRTALQEELDAQSVETNTRVALRDSVRATIREDTLSAGLRNLLAVERGVAESYRVELDVARRINDTLDSTVAVLAAELARTRLALWTVADQRDTALDIVAGYESRLAFSLGDLFAGIGQKAVCAAGGASASGISGGDLLLGAGIGLGFCLLAELL